MLTDISFLIQGITRGQCVLPTYIVQVTTAQLFGSFPSPATPQQEVPSPCQLVVTFQSSSTVAAQTLPCSEPFPLPSPLPRPDAAFGTTTLAGTGNVGATDGPISSGDLNVPVVSV